VNEELQRIIGQQIPIKTRSGNRHLEYIHEVKDDVVILTTNQDGSGKRTVLAIREIESFTMTAQAAAEQIRYR
jgi:ferredoxin-fold anticodon binding domain-containing protein